MNRENEPIDLAVRGSGLYVPQSPCLRVSNCRLIPRLLLPLFVISVLLFLVGVRVVAEELSPDRLRRMIREELDKRGDRTDSIGTPLRVTGFGNESRSFWIVPVLRNGKLVEVYEDDRKRNSVALVVNEPLLKSVKAGLFDQAQVQQLLQERGFTGGEPVAVSFGPMSLFGVLQVGWYQDEGDSFILLSLEGRLVSESDISRLWPAKLPAIRSVKNRPEVGR